MLQLLFRKWWVILLPGHFVDHPELLHFQHPVEVLAGISLWCGLLVLAAGLLGIISWLAADKAEREGMSLLWSILSAAFGLLMILKLLATMKILTVLFGLWMLLTGLFLVQSGWSLRSRNSLALDNGYCRCGIRGRGCHDGIPYWDRCGRDEHPAGFAGFADRPCPRPPIVRQENGGGQDQDGWAVTRMKKD